MALHSAVLVFTLLIAHNLANDNTDDTDDVDFLVGINTGLRLYHSGDNYTHYDTFMTDPGTIWSADYHFSKNMIFAMKNHILFMTTLEPQRKTEATTPHVHLIRHVTRCEGFAVDWVHDRIYWASCGYGGTTIRSCGLDGESEQTVLFRQFYDLNGFDEFDAFNSEVRRMVIDPYSGIVFWVEKYVIQSVETSGRGYNSKLTEAFVNQIALDLRLRRVYYVKYTSLYSMDYTGGENVEHFSVPQLEIAVGLSILGDKVIWGKFDYLMYTIGGIYESPLNLTRIEDVKPLIQILDNKLWYTRVMHPSLQRRPEMDPSVDKDCTHSCVVTSEATTTNRECPLGQALNNDGVSCHTGGVFFLSILLIVAVMMTSFVYLGYKYWRLLRSKFGIPYSRSRGQEGGEDLGAGPTVYSTGEDNVNII